jgi:hypothetical protein
MADSSVLVTPGVGAAIDTRTESTNGNHRSVLVIGDPSDNAGVAPVSGTYGVGVDPKMRPYVSLPVAITAFGSILSASYASILANGSAKEIRYLEIHNSTDQNIYLSFDNATNQLYVPTLQYRIFDLGALGLQVTTPIYAKARSANATSGEVIAMGLAI